jgi:NADH dehydrogenase
MTTTVVFGGTGFLGKRLVQRLAAEGATVRVAVRYPDWAQSALRAAGLDHVTVMHADVRNPSAVGAAIAGADVVVNGVSAYVEKDGVTFEAIHVQGAESVARQAAAAGVARLVLVSDIGADPSSASAYLRTRGRGELAARRAFPGATIVRPSAMFGLGDSMFGTLADLARRLPVVPLIGGNGTRLQPVCVNDVAKAICRMLADSGTAGRTYELVGPRAYTVRELAVLTLRLIGKRRPLMSVPFATAGLLAQLLELLPSPPLTKSQVDLLQAETNGSRTLPGFRELSIQPETVEAVVPLYIGRSRAPRPD